MTWSFKIDMVISLEGHANPGLTRVFEHLRSTFEKFKSYLFLKKKNELLKQIIDNNHFRIDILTHALPCFIKSLECI